MRRISTATKHADKFGAGKHGFRDGDPVNAISATDLEAQFFDHLQEELAAILEEDGGAAAPPVAVDGSAHNQIITKLKALFAKKGSVQNYASVKGLIGQFNAATPNSKFDMSAVAVTLRNPATGETVSKHATATLTCDFSAAGPAANARDKAAVFGTAFLHLYFIYNPATDTLATIASESELAPTLPAGYTHFSYATTLRVAGGGNTVNLHVVRGSRVYYDLSQSATRVLTAGAATSYTTVNASGYVPANYLRAIMQFRLEVTSSSALGFNMNINPLGYSQAFAALATVVSVANTSSYETAEYELFLGNGRQFNYYLSASPSGGGGGYADVMGYIVPNGDV